MQEKSFAFAVKMIKLYKFLTSRKQELVISKQIWKSGTLIGANMGEAV
ncbi:MAG: four helix bundle protein [Saprospirales bacterium]|nr:MAG: four helix bundle protein [Saprospirales bacterium]